MAIPLSVDAVAGLIESLSLRLLSGHSATAVLEGWCTERGLGGEPGLSACRVAGIDKPLDGAQRARLAIDAREPVRYRRVRLTWGPHVLAEADNWYVPARLSPEMNRVLDTTRMPFGRVVHALEPTRRNLGLRRLWTAGEGRAPEPQDALFAIAAVLSAGDGVPFCEVGETYLGAVLACGRP